MCEPSDAPAGCRLEVRAFGVQEIEVRLLRRNNNQRMSEMRRRGGTGAMSASCPPASRTVQSSRQYQVSINSHLLICNVRYRTRAVRLHTIRCLRRPPVLRVRWNNQCDREKDVLLGSLRPCTSSFPRLSCKRSPGCSLRSTMTYSLRAVLSTR